jgi:hypothetical protein
MARPLFSKGGLSSWGWLTIQDSGLVKAAPVDSSGPSAESYPLTAACLQADFRSLSLGSFQKWLAEQELIGTCSKGRHTIVFHLLQVRLFPPIFFFLMKTPEAPQKEKKNFFFLLLFFSII